MRPTGSDFRIFFQGRHASQQPFQIPFLFSSKTRLGLKVIVNLHVMRPTAPTFLVFFKRKCASQESCHIPWVHFPCVFSSKMNLGPTSDCEFTCDAANRSGITKIFPRKTRLAGGIPRRHCHCKSSFVPKPGRRPNVDKGALYVKAMLGYLKRKAMLGYVTHNSAKRMSLRAKRLGCQTSHTTECLLEEDVVKRAKR